MKPHRKNRNRAYYSHHRERVINRKKQIIKSRFWHLLNDQFGRLAKCKIHCSCELCSKKTKIHGFPKSEKAKIEGAKQQIAEYFHEQL